MESLSELKKKALTLLEGIKSLEDLDRFEIEFLGRKQGKLTMILRSLTSLSDQKRRELGSQANELRRQIESKISEKRREFQKKLIELELKREKIDITYPGRSIERGHLHPLTHIRRQAERIFTNMGYVIAGGPQIETEFHAFDALNIPANHPSRDLWDTFWLASHGADRMLLRPHTSPVQIRYMQTHNPPLRIIAPGIVYRSDATDASHDIQFWQIEGLVVGKNITVANLKYTLLVFLQKMFRHDVSLRLRPYFFPFVEPGFEVDISCLNCQRKGCSICKQSGWVELLGAGMVHQNVFEAAGYVKGEWRGFAFGIGLDRLALMKYKIPDIRLFRQNDIRFLSQF